ELDKAYLKEYSENTFYHNYYVHNLHFVAYAAMMEGRKSLALEFIERMESETSEAVIKKFAANVDGLLATRLHIYIRFGLWEDILAVPDYADYRKASIALRHYARTVALANLGRTQEAREELDLFGAATLECPEEWMIAYNPCRDVLALAKEVALGEVYWNEGNTALAIHHLKEATKQEHVLVYTEPPAWMVPVRHALGAILLASGDALAAEMTYREDLSKHRENAWSLLGLSQALKKQGKHTEAEIVNVRFEKAWERSDITATSSCYCVKPQS
ncbi:MAG: hypothetical protein MK213_04140, partial [Planctomycetes bacterium]|nr:hypothetical protein [Planctomycetota bacterium]